jgi:type I restriction enzyme S subunit
MFNLPEIAFINKPIPKTKFLQTANNKIKKEFLKIEKIIWSYNLSVKTLNLQNAKDVEEIQIFTVVLKEKEIPKIRSEIRAMKKVVTPDNEYDEALMKKMNSIIYYLVKNDLVSVFNNGLIRLRTNEKANYEFLYKIVQSKLFHRYVQSIAYGTSTQPNMQINVLLGFELLLPPIEEQKAIAKILTSFDDKIELLQAQNKTLETIAQTIFKEWFLPPYPLKGESHSLELSSENIPKSTLRDLGENLPKGDALSLPKGWRVGKLGELVKPKKGKNITKKQAIEGKYPVIAGGLKPSIWHNKSNTNAPVITISASGANAGFINLHYNPVWASDSSFIDSTITENIYFWYIFLKLNQSKIYDKQEGSAIPHVYPSHLENLDMLIPPKTDIDAFEDIVNTMFSKIKNNIEQIQTLKQTRDTLLPKLMSGQLRVDEFKEGAI